MRFRKLQLSILIAAGFCGGLHGTTSWSDLCGQQPQTGSLQVTTAERLQTEDWWPTKATFPLKSFAGSDACVRCHTDESSTPSSMSRAATRTPDGKFLRAASAELSEKPLRYRIQPKADSLDYSVSDGTSELSHHLEWMMGAGQLGRTFLYEADHRWFQSEITYYTHLSGLDITTGLPFNPNANMSQALGVALSPSDARACFGCHTVHATTSAGFEPAHAEAGLGCEACHGPSQAHVTSASAPRATQESGTPERTVFNPAKLSPADSIDFCGSCHRTFADAVLSLGDQRSTAAVRFQPYRLEESKCWRATQSEKLTCVACHNPHSALSHDASMYDKRCLSCHGSSASTAEHAASGTQTAPSCPKARSNCTSCHMPKVNVASMHGDFTDHFIRIVKSEDGFPK